MIQTGTFTPLPPPHFRLHDHVDGFIAEHKACLHIPLSMTLKDLLPLSAVRQSTHPSYWLDLSIPSHPHTPPAHQGVIRHIILLVALPISQLFQSTTASLFVLQESSYSTSPASTYLSVAALI